MPIQRAAVRDYGAAVAARTILRLRLARLQYFG